MSGTATSDLWAEGRPLHPTYASHLLFGSCLKPFEVLAAWEFYSVSILVELKEVFFSLGNQRTGSCLGQSHSTNDWSLSAHEGTAAALQMEGSRSPLRHPRLHSNNAGCCWKPCCLVQVVTCCCVPSLQSPRPFALAPQNVPEATPCSWRAQYEDLPKTVRNAPSLRRARLAWRAEPLCGSFYMLYMVLVLGSLLQEILVFGSISRAPKFLKLPCTPFKYITIWVPVCVFSTGALSGRVERTPATNGSISWHPKAGPPEKENLRTKPSLVGSCLVFCCFGDPCIIGSRRSTIGDMGIVLQRL